MKEKKTTKKIFNFKLNSIQGKFLVPTATAFIIMVFVSQSIFFFQNQTQFKDSEMETMEYIKSDIDSWLNSVIPLVDMLANSIKYGSMNEEQTLHMFAELQNSDEYILWVYFGGTVPLKDGGVFLVNDTMSPDYDQTTRDWYIEAIAARGEIILTEPYLDASGSNTYTVITFAKAVYDNNNRLLGVVAIDVSLNDLYSILKKYTGSSRKNLNIVLSDGKYVSHENTNYIINDNYNIFNDMEDISPIRNNFFGSNVFFEYYKGNYYTSVHLDTDWYIVNFGSNVEMYKQLLNMFILAAVCCFLLFLGQALLVRIIVLPLNKTLKQAGENMKEMSEGNFTVEFDKKSKSRKDEVGTLARSTDEMKSSLGSILIGVKNISGSINSLVDKMNKDSGNLSHRTETQSASLEEVASSLEQMSAAVRQTSDSAKVAEGDSSKVKAVSHSGVEITKETIANMQEIHEASKKISDITTVIENIAFQTNILALNAAVGRVSVWIRPLIPHLQKEPCLKCCSLVLAAHSTDD